MLGVLLSRLVLKKFEKNVPICCLKLRMYSLCPLLLVLTISSINMLLYATCAVFYWWYANHLPIRKAYSEKGGFKVSFTFQVFTPWWITNYFGPYTIFLRYTKLSPRHDKLVLILQGWVVQRSISANPGLKVNLLFCFHTF